MPRREPPVSGSDLANLRASGLTDRTILANGVRTEYDGAKLAAMLNRPRGSNLCLGSGLVFPYRDLAGTVNCFARVRPLMPRVRDGKAIKYEQPKDTPMRAYFPAESLEKLRDATKPIALTEGEKKALALSQLDLSPPFDLASIGLGGVWCGCRKNAAGGHDLIDDLNAITWTDRDVYIVFDYDQKATTRRDVDSARRRLAKALREAGAREIYNVELPAGPEGAKQGVDDFLLANGTEAFQQLVEQAKPVPAKVLTLMTQAAGRTDAANAQRLVAKFGDDVRWVGPWKKWIVWDGQRWKLDQALVIDLKAKDVAADLFAEIAAAIREHSE